MTRPSARSKPVTPKSLPSSRKTTRRRATRSRDTSSRSRAMPLLRSLAESARIHLLVKNNPRREGGVPHEHWEQHMKEGITLMQFFEGGGSWMHLRADIARGHVVLRK